MLERRLGGEDRDAGDEAHDLGTDVVHEGTRHALERARKDEEPEDDRRAPADRLPVREGQPAGGDAEERDQEAPAEHRVGERPERLVESERRVPEAVEESGEPGDDEPAAREGDRTRHRKRDQRKGECLAEPASELGREGDVRESEGRAEVHRVDEEMRRREEVFEWMGRVPAPIPSESKPEREDVEDDGEPEQAVGGVEADTVLSCVGCDRCGGHAQMDTTQHRRDGVEPLSVEPRGTLKSHMRSPVAQWQRG